MDINYYLNDYQLTIHRSRELGTEEGSKYEAWAFPESGKYIRFGNGGGKSRRDQVCGIEREGTRRAMELGGHILKP